MSNIVRPKSYPIRDVKDNSQNAGKVFNPPRYCDMGGLSSASKWPGSDLPGVQAPEKGSKSAEMAKRATSE